MDKKAQIHTELVVNDLREAEISRHHIAAMGEQAGQVSKILVGAFPGGFTLVLQGFAVKRLILLRRKAPRVRISPEQMLQLFRRGYVENGFHNRTFYADPPR